MSQFWPGLRPPTRQSFPMRNAVMSGLALGTVVVEASHTQRRADCRPGSRSRTAARCSCSSRCWRRRGRGAGAAAPACTWSANRRDHDRRSTGSMLDGRPRGLAATDGHGRRADRASTRTSCSARGGGPTCARSASTSPRGYASLLRCAHAERCARRGRHRSPTASPTSSCTMPWPATSACDGDVARRLQSSSRRSSGAPGRPRALPRQDGREPATPRHRALRPGDDRPLERPEPRREPPAARDRRRARRPDARAPPAAPAPHRPQRSRPARSARASSRPPAALSGERCC